MKPVNPLKLSYCPGEDCAGPDVKLPDGSYWHSWECYMKYDLVSLIMEADSIAVLPNWKYSKGAKVEMGLSRELNYPILYISRAYKVVSKGNPNV